MGSFYRRGSRGVLAGSQEWVQLIQEAGGLRVYRYDPLSFSALAKARGRDAVLIELHARYVRPAQDDPAEDGRARDEYVLPTRAFRLAYVVRAVYRKRRPDHTGGNLYRAIQ